jgi:hypothetical protein
VISQRLDLCDVTAFADPAGSKTEVKKVQARSALAVVGGDAYDRVFVLHVWSARTSTDQFVAEIFNTFERWRPRVFGIEANAMQSLFADMLIREARLRNVQLPFAKVTQPTRIEKPFRNRSALQTDINEGRFLMLRGEHIEARNELETHPMCSQFDMVDSIASARSLLRRTSKQQALSTEQLQRADYLRKSGVDPRLIDAAMRETAESDVPPRPS